MTTENTKTPFWAKHARVLFAATSLSLAAGAHAESMLRVMCDPADARAEVSVDGKFKGECPVDVQLNDGQHVVRVTRRVTDEKDYFHEEQIRLGDGVVKKLEILKLKETRLNARGTRRMELQVAAAKKGAAGGDPESMKALGDYYLKGEGGLPKDVKAGIAWLTRAAQAGDEDAMLSLGDLYNKKDSGSYNAAEGNAWTQRAIQSLESKAQSGDADAMRELLWVYLGVDVSKARSWSQRYAERLQQQVTDPNNFKAMYNLALAYAIGMGVPSDDAKKELWFGRFEAAAKSAADAGDAEAMFLLSQYYRFQRELEGPNRDLYLRSLKAAAAKGYKKAIAELDIQTKLGAGAR